MPEISIENVDDPRVAAYVRLRDRQLRLREGRFIVEGQFLVQRLLASSCRVDSVLIADHHRQRLDVAAEIPVYRAPAPLIQQIAGFPFHRGILACGVRPARRDLSELHIPKEVPALAAICVAVRDAENLGGILRNCAAFGVDLVVLAEQCADPWSRRALRVSMGAPLHLNLGWSTDWAGDMTRLSSEWGFELVATVLDRNAEPLGNAHRRPRTGLLFGNEGYGLESDWRDQCDRQVTIPMDLQTDSLNVAVASGIFLYHFTMVAPR